MEMNKKNLLINGGYSVVSQQLISMESQNKKIVCMVRNKKDDIPLSNMYECDSTKPEEVKGTLEEIIANHSSLDEYVHLIGSILLKPLHSTSLEEWSAVMDTNLNSIFYALKYILPVMQKQRSGTIVLVSSVVAQVGLINHEVLSAAKGAVESLTRSLAMTYSGSGIRVNCVAPSLTKTKMAEKLVNNEIAVKATTSLNAIKRIGEPQDIANAISFLLSERSSFITGQVINVDGGLTHLRTPPKL